MASIVVLITAEPLEVTHGEWCPTCALPSGTTATLALSIDGRLHEVITFRRCTDCGEETPAT